MIESVERKVGCFKSSLLQQRPKNEHGVVASRKGLVEFKDRLPTAFGFGDFPLGKSGSCIGYLELRVIRYCALDRSLKIQPRRKDALRRRSYREQQHRKSGGRPNLRGER